MSTALRKLAREPHACLVARAYCDGHQPCEHRPFAAIADRGSLLASALKTIPKHEAQAAIAKGIAAAKRKTHERQSNTAS
jgi:hypothetical protein